MTNRTGDKPAVHRMQHDFQVVLSRPLHVLAILGAVFLYLPHGAWAQSPATEMVEISAQASEAVPPGTHLRLQLADDSDQNRQLAAVAKEALTKAGFIVDSTNPTVTLRMETKNIVQGSKKDDSIGSLNAGNIGSPNARDDVGVDLNVRLWSSTKNSLLKRNAGKDGQAPVFAIVFEAYDEIARKPAWHGEARMSGAASDDFEARSVMIRQLVPRLGKTVARTAVPLR